MDLLSFSSSRVVLSLFLALLILSRGVFGATFIFVNKCGYTVWPGILANAGSPSFESTGFVLQKDETRAFESPTGWSGRFWGRTWCNSDDSGIFTCSTGDCGSGQMECRGSGATPPVTLAEFTLGTGSQDFYDVSLVDGYNLPMIVEASGGSGMCATTGCVSDLNQLCPSELKVDYGACKSACGAFGTPEFCCSGAYYSPATCKPSIFSEIFKSACPRSYSYAYDDSTSTFTCSGADYTITFCPSVPSQKSSKDNTTPETGTSIGGSGVIDGSGSGAAAIVGGSNPESGAAVVISGSGPELRSETTADSQSQATTVADGSSWLAGLAMGESARACTYRGLHYALVASASVVGLVSFVCL